MPGRIILIPRDYTEVLPTSLHEGDEAIIEGPYGRFTFDDDHERRIWIGAGVGITPCVARMKQLAGTPGGKSIDLIHVTRDFFPAALALLEADAKRADIDLHVLIKHRDGRLSGERLQTMLPDWRSASFWFCGPAAFGDALRRDLADNGLAVRHFHQALFSMR